MTKSKKRSRSRDRESEDTHKRLRRLEKMMESFLEAQNVASSQKDDDLEKSTKESVVDNTQEQGTGCVGQNKDLLDLVDKTSVLDSQQLEEFTPSVKELPGPGDGSKDQVESTESTVEVVTLDQELEDLLGKDPTNPNKKLVNVHPSLVPRWSTWLAEGLSKDIKDSLLDKYPLSGNICLEAPELNEEIVSTLNEAGLKRDQLFVAEQNLVGFIINEDKSSQSPQQSCKYLGFVINSVDMTLSLPKEKRTKITNAIVEFLGKKVCQIRELAGLIGLLVEACSAVPYGMLHTKILEREKLKVLIINDQDFDFKDCEILIRVDNTTAIAYINRMGGVQYPELNKLARDIWYWCEERRIWVFASYIPSKENTDADRESRRTNIDTEWELGGSFFDSIAADTSTGGEAYPGCREALRTTYQRRGLPEKALDILISSLTDSTLQQYNSALKNWWNYCHKLKSEPLESEINTVLKFLTARFKQGAAYGTLNAERSAINLMSTVDLGKDPLITRFFKGVFKMRPAKPKYDVIWSSETVLKWAETLKPLESLDLKSLTLKLVSLLALATAHRVQTLSLIKLSNIVLSEGGTKIIISDHIKTSRPGAPQPVFILPFLNSRKPVCVARVLGFYINQTKDLRGKTDKLFITFKKPHHEATSQSISRWIKLCLIAAGIDKHFTAHSTRHAATSAAEFKGIDVNIIKSTAGWSERSTTFAKF